MNFTTGLVVQGASTYGAAPSSFVYMQGTKGWASLSPAFPFDEERRLSGTIQGRLIERRFRVTDEFAPELDAFASAIQAGTAVEPDGEQGLRDMAILRSIYEAARRKKPVEVRYK